MSSEKFCLRWNDFENNISNAFKELRDDSEFFDVTLACDDDQMQAHKVILSACSPFFRNILRRNHHQHPLLYMKGVKYTDLQAVLNFMYHGEVNVAQEELNSFLAVAEDLRVKGLTQNQPSSHQASSKISSEERRRSPAPAPTRDKEKVPDAASSQTSQLPKRAYLPQQHRNHDEDIQEIIPIKSEPLSQPQQVYRAEEEHTVSTYQEDAGYEDYGDYQDQGYHQVDTTMDHNITMQEGHHGKGENRNVLNQYIKKSVADDGHSVYECSLCGQKNSQRVNVLNHVESVHFPNSFIYTCKHCQAEFYSKNARNVHVSRNHKNENKN